MAATLVAIGGHCNVTLSIINVTPCKQIVWRRSAFSCSVKTRHIDLFTRARNFIAGVPSIKRRRLYSIKGGNRSSRLFARDILLSQGVCKIIDFGLSTDARILCTGGCIGNVYYMASEIVAGERYDPTLVDMWSLEIMWLTGSPL